ncbi:tail fiber domain-containing protein [Emticicia sp. C21]|uniref:tail fiber domain-containing protein n=1 Tax=Emticicia sp. C21 TaxID=2302915 RepID=UPI001314638F|nr:tail fiber domain-containing protein [Emticicia sp. C21]
MKRPLWMIGLCIALSRLAFAQSATLLPTASEFNNDSADESAFAVKATMSNVTPGKYSAAIRAFNSGTNSSAMAIWAINMGSGMGIRVSSEQGLGISTSSYEGVGLYAESQKESAAHFATSLSDNVNDAVIIDSKGLGSGLSISVKNTLSTNPALWSYTVGTGAGAIIKNANADGKGAGLIAGKDKPFTQAFSLDAHADLEVRHPIENSTGMTGLRIMNTGVNKQNWTFYTTNNLGYLNLYCNGTLRGNFNPNTGAYTATSDFRLKTAIKDYDNTLDRVLKMQVKSYQLFKSDKTEIGLVAQETLKLFPEVVYDNMNDKGEQFYTMDYSRIGVVAIKAIQEQQSIITQQQQALQQHEEAIAILKNEISELKKALGK